MSSFGEAATLQAPAEVPAVTTPTFDAVVVSYRSRDTLRDCVAPLAAMSDVAVVVVDNASDDGSPEIVADLDVRVVRAERNGGFAYGCNIGARIGHAPYVLFLNPDARIDVSALAELRQVLESDPGTGLAAPRLLYGDGSLAPSQRHFPDPVTTFGEALFLHRLCPRARWSSELMLDPADYDRDGEPDWVSGACMLVRRSALEQVGGLDERYFLYCEDTDLCARLRAAGWGIHYTPRATVGHLAGASGSRAELRSVLARSRVRYARVHESRSRAWVEAAGVTLGELSHAVANVHLRDLRAGHLRAARAAWSEARA